MRFRSVYSKLNKTCIHDYFAMLVARFLKYAEQRLQCWIFEVIPVFLNTFVQSCPHNRTFWKLVKLETGQWCQQHKKHLLFFSHFHSHLYKNVDLCTPDYVTSGILPARENYHFSGFKGV